MCEVDWQELQSLKGTSVLNEDTKTVFPISPRVTSAVHQEFAGKLNYFFYGLFFDRCLRLLLFLWESKGLWEYSSYPQLLLGSYTGKCCVPISTWSICLKFLMRLFFVCLFVFWWMMLWQFLTILFFNQTVAVGSYLIAHGFFSVYSMCVDTLFLCFCK